MNRNVNTKIGIDYVGGGQSSIPGIDGAAIGGYSIGGRPVCAKVGLVVADLNSSTTAQENGTVADVNEALTVPFN